MAQRVLIARVLAVLGGLTGAMVSVLGWMAVMFAEGMVDRIGLDPSDARGYTALAVSTALVLMAFAGAAAARIAPGMAACTLAVPAGFWLWYWSQDPSGWLLLGAGGLTAAAAVLLLLPQR